MTKPRSLRVLSRAAFLALLVLISVSAFVVGRTWLAPRGEASAASLPVVVEKVPLLPEQVEPAPPQPGFQGDLHGFMFYRSLSLADITLEAREAKRRATSPKCKVTTSGGNNARYATEEEGNASRLNFAVTYLPAGALSTGVTVSACEDDVVFVGRSYILGYIPGPGQYLSIGRAAGLPVVVPNNTPQANLEATTIRGRPAVIAHPTPSNPLNIEMSTGLNIYIRDGFSVWRLSTRGWTLEEVLKVAEGLR